jgi:hypothetical protein
MPVALASTGEEHFLRNPGISQQNWGAEKRRLCRSATPLHSDPMKFARGCAALSGSIACQG